MSMVFAGFRTIPAMDVVKDPKQLIIPKKIISVHEDTYQSNFDQINHREGYIQHSQMPDTTNKYSSMRTAQNYTIKGKNEESRDRFDKAHSN